MSRFSHRSRSEMLRQVCSIDRRKTDGAKFVTLTYGQFVEDPKSWKRDLAAFDRRLRRQFPSAAGFWKLEPQAERGRNRGEWAPHFHLLIFGLDGETVSTMKDWVSESWHAVVCGSVQMDADQRGKHLRAGTQVAEVRTWRGVTFYAGKYIGKGCDDELPEFWNRVGRWWGSFNKKQLPIEMQTAPLTAAEFHRLKDAMIARYHEAMADKMRRLEERGVKVEPREFVGPGETEGFTVFMDYPDVEGFISQAIGRDFSLAASKPLYYNADHVNDATSSVSARCGAAGPDRPPGGPARSKSLGCDEGRIDAGPGSRRVGSRGDGIASASPGHPPGVTRNGNS